MRLIDADACTKLFDKEFKETMRLIRQGETHLDNLAEGFTEAHMVIQSIQTVDAVEVVRCKDCKHKGWIQEPCHGKSVDFCNVFDSTINNPEKCFCYYGERRKK